jgi:hypothetical protein
MAIRKQNQTIWVLSGIVFLMLVIYLFRDGRFHDFFLPKAAVQVSENSGLPMENFGDQVGLEGVGFSETLSRLSKCLSLSEVQLPAKAASIESVLQVLEKDFGRPTHQADRWMRWSLRTPEGKERDLRLEITESDSGHIVRELSYFEVQEDGTRTLLSLSPEQLQNPDDEVINQLLRDGDVFSKERAAVAFFQSTERIEYIERGEELTEVNIFGKRSQFRCQDVRAPSNCQCLEEGL